MTQTEYFDLLVEQGFITKYNLQILNGEIEQVFKYLRESQFVGSQGNKETLELKDVINAETLDILNTAKNEAKEPVEFITLVNSFKNFLSLVATYVGLEHEASQRKIPFEVLLPYLQLCLLGNRGAVTTALLAIPSTSIMHIPGATRYAFRQAITTVSMLQRGNQLTINPNIQ